MFRLRPIRHRPERVRVPLRAADGVFTVLLLTAFGFGGQTAWSGAPRFMSLLFPPGLMAAQASSPSPSAHLTLAPVDAQPVVPPPVETAAVQQSKNPAIALVIDDLGEDLAGTDRAMALPAPVALSFLPFADDSRWLAPEAIWRGHEVLVHVPMETLSGKDAGPMALTVDLPAAEVTRRLAWDLERVPGFVGINNHEGSRFTSDAAALAPVVQMLAARHVFFFDSRTAATSQVVRVSRAAGVPSAARDVFLDDDLSADAIAAQFAALEEHAKRDGIAIAIGHPHDATLTALMKWTAVAGRRGFELVPLSEAIRRKTVRETVVAGR